MSTVLNVVLCHQSPGFVQKLVQSWRRVASQSAILLAYGGSSNDFACLEHSPKVFIEDMRLRTRDHQRERQSYHAIWRAASGWMRSEGKHFDFVYIAEFDHHPLVPDLNARQVECLRKEKADVLAFHLHRIDETNHPHYLYNAVDESFREFIAQISCRPSPDVVLSMLGTGSFWAAEAFHAVSDTREPFPIYFEIFLPTVAHHLGFRVRDFTLQNRFVRNLGDWKDDIPAAEAAGAWSVHPLKEILTK